jgi:hypothetical protein
MGASAPPVARGNEWEVVMSQHQPGDLPPDHPVSQQLSAYNEHRLDDFVACFAHDVVLARGDGAVRALGTEQLREMYIPVFAIVGRRATIVNRIAVGPWVIDHEIVSDDSGRSFEAVAAYHCVGGLIDEVRLLD